MRTHEVRVGGAMERKDELAWKLAELASDPVAVDDDVAAMVANRVVDNAAVALAALDRHAPATARAQGLAHPREGGAVLYGLGPDVRIDAEWAAWANGTAVRELDFHDTFLAADFAHPGDNIPPLLAVAQQRGCNGEALVRAVATAYEVQIALTRAIDLHSHRIDHVAHLGPAVACGLGTLLELDVAVTAHAVGQALHVSTSTRQSRKGAISSWKAFAPAHTGKLAVEAVDRCARGEGAPAPIYEGEDGVIARLLDGPDAVYAVELPEPGEPKRAIMQSFTKAHSAEYQAQALIDLAFRVRERIDDLGEVERIVIHTSDHTHNVIGTGSGDPEKFEPQASRETLDHSIPYIFAVALQDGTWHHVDSYAAQRAKREDTVALWQAIETREDEHWTARYHEVDPERQAFGGRAEVHLKGGGETIDAELALADAHPGGAHPFDRDDYLRKLDTLTEGILVSDERQRFGDLVERLASLGPNDLAGLTPAARVERATERDDRGIF